MKVSAIFTWRKQSVLENQKPLKANFDKLFVTYDNYVFGMIRFV